MEQKELLPDLTSSQVENLVKFIKLNWQERIDWDNVEGCCFSDDVEEGITAACDALREGYGIIGKLDTGKENDDDE